MFPTNHVSVGPVVVAVSNSGKVIAINLSKLNYRMSSSEELENATLWIRTLPDRIVCPVGVHPEKNYIIVGKNNNLRGILNSLIHISKLSTYANYNSFIFLSCQPAATNVYICLTLFLGPQDGFIRMGLC